MDTIEPNVDTNNEWRVDTSMRCRKCERIVNLPEWLAYWESDILKLVAPVV